MIVVVLLWYGFEYLLYDVLLFYDVSGIMENFEVFCVVTELFVARYRA